MKSKGRCGDAKKSVVSCRPGSTVSSAARKMTRKTIGCLVVEGPGGQLEGILTERDIVSRVVARHLDASSTPVGSVMTCEPKTVHAGTPLNTIRRRMVLHGIRHMPVVRRGRTLRMVSMRDVMGEELRRDRAMRAAAEEAATLSTCLRTLDLDEVVALVTQEVPRLFHAARCVFRLPPRSDGRHGILGRHNCHSLARNIDRSTLNEPRIQEGKPFLAGVPAACEGCRSRRPRVVVPIGPCAAAPSGQAGPGGVLCMCDLPNASKAHHELILYKASLVQGIIHSHLANAQVHQATRQQLTIDVVTGVLSRRGFEEKLESQFLLARRYGGAFCVAMLDLDQFKAVNDRLGHAAGDKALQTLAQVITEEKRQTDVLCRFGGDEFVLLLPHTDRSAAAVVLERIRKRILAAPIVPDQPVSISGGLAQFEGHETDSANELLRRADLAMYRAKQGGRNRVEMWRKNREEDPRWIDPRRVQNLQARVQRLSQRSQEIFLQSVWGLVQTVEARDPYTRSHSDNVTRYAVALATARGLPGGDVDVIRRAGMVHDIGKIGVPDTILRKPRRLTASELQIMQQHPLIAVQILGEMKFLDREMRLVRSHHERWDGQGYPDGIAHNAIPFGARLLAVADAFDAITSNRVYRTSRSVADAVQILQDSSGTQFDPEAVEILQKVIDAAGRKRPHAGDLTSTHILAHLGPQ